MQQAGPGRVAQAQRLALERADRDAGRFGHAAELARPSTRGHDDGVGLYGAAVGEVDALHARAGRVEAQAGDRGVRRQARAGPLRRAGERGDDACRLDAVVAGDLQGEADRRGERGFERPRGARAQPLGGERERVAEADLPLERLGLVAVAGQEQRARLAQPDGREVEAGVARELGRERRPPLGGGEPEAQRPLAGRAVLGLRDRGEHPRGDGRGAAAELAALEDGDRGAAGGEAPGRGDPDDAAADHGDVDPRDVERGRHGLPAMLVPRTALPD